MLYFYLCIHTTVQVYHNALYVKHESLTKDPCKHIYATKSMSSYVMTMLHALWVIWILIYLQHWCSVIIIFTWERLLYGFQSTYHPSWHLSLLVVVPRVYFWVDPSIKCEKYEHMRTFNEIWHLSYIYIVYL